MADYDHGIIYLNDGFNDNTLKNIKEIANGNSNVKGFATIMCAILLLGGIQLLSIGILGKYLEKTCIETIDQFSLSKNQILTIYNYVI